MLILGCGVFLFMVVAMYLMLDRTSSKEGYPGQMNEAQRQLAILEEKVDILETDLNKNHDIINQLKNAVKAMSEGGPIPKIIPKDDEKDGNAWVFHRVGNQGRDGAGADVGPVAPVGAKAHVNQMECSFATGESGHSADIQMMDVYEELKFENANGGVWKQGFDITYDINQWKNKPLKVYVVPHSHNDPGWIKTFSKYYQDQTQHILDNAVEKLKQYPAMKFIWAEISYLSEWWGKTTETKKNMAKKLISSGQWEIVTGGWVMVDEANCHYFAILDQFIEGHEWMDEMLGIKPKISWSIDPFGMSPTLAYLLKGMGYDAMVIQRIHYEVKKYLAKRQQLEFMWRQNWDHETSTDMFCHMMPFYSYDAPHSCGPDPKVCCQFDFKRLPGGRVNCPWKIAPVKINDGNVEHRSEVLLDQYRKKAQLYKSNVLLVPLGDDFRYDKAIEWDLQYENYEKLFSYMNSRKDWHIQAQFGTLNDYFSALWYETNAEVGTQPEGFPSLSGDFYAYADREKDYWTGYFTSRPFHKHLDRVVESHLRAAEIIFSYAYATARKEELSHFQADELVHMLSVSRKSLGLFQHHDAITGTAKDHVVVDYGKKLLLAIEGLRTVIMESMYLLMLDDRSFYKPGIKYFNLDEVRASHDAIPTQELLLLDEEDPRAVMFFNPLAQPRQELVRLRVSSLNVEVTDSEGNPVNSQGGLVFNQFDSLDDTVYDLIFEVDLKPMGLKKYWILDSGSKVTSHHQHSMVEFFNMAESGNIRRGNVEVLKHTDSSNKVNIDNDNLFVKFDGNTGLLKSVTTKIDNQETNVDMQFVMYGTNKAVNMKSGAYLFLPDGPAKEVSAQHAPFRVTTGPLYSEVSVYLYCVQHTVSLANTAGPESFGVGITNVVDVRNERNKELVMRIRSSIENGDGIFYTDLNGFQIQKRKKYSDKLPLQANFYPMPTMAYIEDDDSRLSILTGQPLGVSSLEMGWLEVVLDRRLMQDDNRGVQQGVQDNRRTPSFFKLLLERKVDSSNYEPSVSVPVGYPSLLGHYTSLALNHPIFTHFVSMAERQEQSNLKGELALIQRGLPCDMHIVNLRTRSSHKANAATARREAFLILHRLGFDCRYPGLRLQCMTQGGQVDTSYLFSDMNIRDIQATSLSGMKDEKSLGEKATVEIQPMELKTYRIKFH